MFFDALHQLAGHRLGNASATSSTQQKHDRSTISHANHHSAPYTDDSERPQDHHGDNNWLTSAIRNHVQKFDAAMHHSHAASLHAPAHSEAVSSHEHGSSSETTSALAAGSSISGLVQAHSQQHHATDVERLQSAGFLSQSAAGLTCGDYNL